MTKFFISDTHFYHDKILDFGSRRAWFTSLEEMHEHIIAKWNSVVTDEDTVYHLGDIAMGPNIDWTILERLNGKKIWVLGNHDTDKKIKDAAKYFSKIVGYEELNGEFIVSHIPVHTSQLDRWVANIHGHMHDNIIEDDSRYFSVCCEQIGYTPISLPEIKTKLREKGIFKNAL